MNEEIDLNNLQSRLIEIEHELQFQNWKANDYLYITRPTQEVLRKYLRKLNLPLWKRILWVIYFPVKIFFWYFVNIVYAFVKPGHRIKLKNINYGTLFISHATIDNPNSQSGDRIFGKMFEIGSKKANNIVYFLNHTNESFSKKNLRIHKSIKQEFILNSKNLSILKMIKLINQNNRITVSKFFKKIPSMFAKDFDSNWLGVLEYQIKRATLSNLVIYENVISILKTARIRNIVMTFEGHAYETLIYKATIDSGKGSNIFMYQHSPTSNGQLALYKFLETYGQGITILFSSKYSQKHFLKVRSLNKVRKYLVGSVKEPSTIKLSKKRNSILLAPEGLNSTLSEFLNLARKICSASDFELILRIHPSLKINRSNRKKLRKITKAFRINISNHSLAHDFQQSVMCFFRASSVGLESLTYGIPTYFYGSKWANYFVNPHQHVFKEIDNFNFSNLNNELKKQISVKKRIDYYNKIDIKLLEKLLR